MKGSRLTFLTPTWNQAKVAKTYNQPEKSGKVSDYNLGKYFTYEEVSFDSLHDLITALNSRPNSIAIYGTPDPLATMDDDTPPRQTEYFPYPEGQTLHMFDIDDWKVPASTIDVVNPVLNDPKSMAEMINVRLRAEGLDYLADVTKVINLTSSQWGVDHINCHIYVLFDEPVRVEALREYAIALSNINQRKILDDAVYKSVQPQFYAAPTCMGFSDPLEGKRIFLDVQDKPCINTKEFTEIVNTTIKKLDWSPANNRNNLPAIGKTWVTTIREHVNDENGINQPCYRAAAQLVQSEGRSHVISNINKFAQQMHDEVWRVLTQKDGERGRNAKDKQTYDVARFRQYLQSATQKDFGDKVDKLVDQINDAIDKAVKGDMQGITSAPVVLAMAELKANHYPRFLPIESRIKQDKIMQMGQLNKLLKSGGNKQASDPDGIDIFNTGESSAVEENRLIDTVIQQFEYWEDTFGNRYAVTPGNGDGGYLMQKIDGNLLATYYTRGLKLSGDNVSLQFGQKALTKLMGLETESRGKFFKSQLIGSRVVSEDGMLYSPVWINLGKQFDGVYRAAKITTEGVELMRHQDSKVKWVSDTPTLQVATNEMIEERFGTDVDLIPYIIETLPKFIFVEEFDMTKLLMWIVASLSNKSVAYIAELVGEAGSGKSTTADLLKDLIDPSKSEGREGSDRTHFNGANDAFLMDIEQRHVTILDNLSKLTTKEQDTLCGIATGLKHSQRILYTQKVISTSIKRPLITTSLAPIVTRPDLRTRVITIQIRKAPYNPNFMADWNVEKPYLVAAILQLTQKAVKLFCETTEKPDDLGARDVFLAAVDSAVKGYDKVDFEYVQKFRMAEAWDDFYDIAFVEAFALYLDENFRYHNTVEISTIGLHKKFKSWCLHNAGREINGGEITLDAVPETGRGLGWQIVKYAGTLSKVSDWKYDGKHPIVTNRGTVHRFIRKEKIKNISLDEI